MYDDHRFETALAMLETFAEPFMARSDVFAVSVRRRSLSDENDPGGPVVVVISDRPDEVRQAQASGSLPAELTVGDETFAVIVEHGRLEPDYAHTTEDNPMRPGSNIGTVNGAGTLGAPVSAPGNGYKVITAGHVVGGVNTVVYQPGAYRHGMTLRRSGAVTTNRMPQHDVALLHINRQFSVDATPFDSPPPTPTQPAVGLYLCRSANHGCFMDLGQALRFISATMDHVDRVRPADINRHSVYASGARSGEFNGLVTGRGVYRWTDHGTPGPHFYGFEVDFEKSGNPGDSGAVAVIDRGSRTTWIDDGSQTLVETHVDEDALDYLPGTFQALDKLLTGDGSGIKVDGQGLDKTAGRQFLRRLLAALSQTGKLELEVSAERFQRPCRRVEAGRMPRTRPGLCQVVILHENVEPPATVDPLAPGEEGTGKTKCCTFGDHPLVTVDGDDAVAKRVSVALTGTVSVAVEYSVTQRVGRAQFRRHGYCYKKVCNSPEYLAGRVWLRRKSRLRISVVGGRVVELPFLGPIQAGAVSFQRLTNSPLHKDFKILCKKP